MADEPCEILAYKAGSTELVLVAEGVFRGHTAERSHRPDATDAEIAAANVVVRKRGWMPPSPPRPLQATVPPRPVLDCCAAQVRAYHPDLEWPKKAGGYDWGRFYTSRERSLLGFAEVYTPKSDRTQIHSGTGATLTVDYCQIRRVRIPHHLSPSVCLALTTASADGGCLTVSAEERRSHPATRGGVVHRGLPARCARPRRSRSRRCPVWSRTRWRGGRCHVAPTAGRSPRRRRGRVRLRKSGQRG